MKSLYLLALLLLTPVSAHGDGHEEKTLLIEMHDGQFFTMDGGSERNPDLVLTPGASYQVTVRNVGSSGVHDFNIDLLDVSTDDFHGGEDLAPGEEVFFMLEVPESAAGTGRYWCNPHDPQMSGKVSFDAQEPGEESPGIGLLSVTAVLALFLSRR